MPASRSLPANLRAITVAVSSLALVLQVLAFVTPPAAFASVYNNTDPVNTVCGNGSHAVYTWRSYYLRETASPFRIIALVDMRYSKYCNTVWTRVTNKTGSASGHYPAHSITVDEKVYTYDCPASGCLQQSTRSNGDVLAANGDSAWSNQLDMPTGAIILNARQPPTARSQAWAYVAGTTNTIDMAREPEWTQWHNNFQNPPGNRSGNEKLSCDNSNYDNGCTSWGETGGSYATIHARIASSFALTGVDEQTDMQQVISYWNSAWVDSPLVIVCSSSCAEDVLIKGSYGLGNYGQTFIDAESGNVPHLADHALMEMPLEYTYDHSCGTVDDGCASTGFDDRPILAHEFGHALGLMHCDLDAGAMCRVTASGGDDNAIGTLYWHPQYRDVWGLQAAYP
jgi:hypothetical protein